MSRVDIQGIRRGSYCGSLILVHGMWQGAWVWSRLLPLLPKSVETFVVALPGSQPEQTDIGSISLDDYVAHVAEIVRRATAPVRLLGHSGGGLTISSVAERLPDRISRLIYLAAFMLPHNYSIAKTYAKLPPEGGGTAPHLRFSDDGMSSTLEPKAAGDLLYGGAGPRVRRSAVAQLCAQPQLPRETSLQLSDSRYGQVPRTYIECLQDQTLSLDLQRNMQRLSPCDVISLDCDHAPQLSVPRNLAQHLRPYLKV